MLEGQEYNSLHISAHHVSTDDFFNNNNTVIVENS